MRVLAILQDELIIRSLDAVLLPNFEVDFLIESRSLARRLHDAGLQVITGDPRRIDTYLKADISPNTCFIVEDNGRRSIKKMLSAIRDAGGTLIYVLHTGTRNGKGGGCRTRGTAGCHPSRSLGAAAADARHRAQSLADARAVLQYQRYFADADRVLILLHNDPDPDALASGLALRNLLRRTKTTAIIGAMQGVTRPENLRMANMLDIQVEQVTPATLQEFDRIATVDVQPHYFGGLLDRADLVDRPPSRATGLQRRVQGHPRRLRLDLDHPDRAPACGGREHLRADRHGDALRHQVRHAVLRASHQSCRPRGLHVPLPAGRRGADPKMEGAEITLERLAYVTRASQTGVLREQVFTAFVGEAPREDFIPYTADFFLQLEDVKWTIVAGIVGNTFILSVRNLGYSRNAGEFVKRWFGDVGSAGGHRAMAKAVVPVDRFRQKFGDITGPELTAKIADMAEQFFHEAPVDKEKKREPVAR